MTATRRTFRAQRDDQEDGKVSGESTASLCSNPYRGAVLMIRWWLLPCLYEAPLWPQTPTGGATGDKQARKPRGGQARKNIVGGQAKICTTQLTEAALSQTVDEISRSVQPWSSGHFRLVKTLQAAPRSHGQVDKMQGADGPVAVKMMPNWWLKQGQSEFKVAYPNETEHPWRDMGVIMALNQREFPYACDFHGIFRDMRTSYIVTSLATEGDLFSWSNQAPKPGKQREAAVKEIMTQLSTGVKILHDMGIAHRDLSLENVLLTRGGDSGGLQVKIIDYSMSALARFGRGYKHGKSAYKAPEMFGKEDYDLFLSDDFATGVILYSLAWQRYPWKSTQPGRDQGFTHAQKFGLKSLERHRNKGNKDTTQMYSSGFFSLLEGILAMEPPNRLNLGESCFKFEDMHCSVWTTGWL